MKILVTGATGNIGRKVVDHLLDAGAQDVRALTVDPVRAALPEGVEVVRGHLRRPETLAAALDGVGRLYLAPTPDTVVDVLALAREAGVSHVVDLSGEPESWWGSVATAVEGAGPAWTHLWPGDFMENALSWAPGIAARRAVREPYPQGRSAPTAMDDIARVAAACLLTDAHAGQALSITGPEVLTRVELAERIGEALGHRVVFETVTRDEAVAEMAQSMGADAEWYVDTILAGSVDNPVQVSTAIEDVTGKPATTFAQWARANAAAFRG
ncbi:NmrA family NAD(P)-binding protein [Pseudonocardia humida]|uniref:NAD(P)H-binding protein n=1 Tax=Pseudonocardia humida TaxID=2800819 RepID=A0ABT0ZVQ2_9PSEU|nr:NAD(P)H-binding protein [Pseudonocardia humida]MCO1654817.1 NAD(P)H-binding protein [Pseudonocardia humida]